MILSGVIRELLSNGDSSLNANKPLVGQIDEATSEKGQRLESGEEEV